MSFDDCNIEADQEIDLKQDPAGVVDYPLKAMKFSNITHLSIQVYPALPAITKLFRFLAILEATLPVYFT